MSFVQNSGHRAWPCARRWTPDILPPDAERPTPVDAPVAPRLLSPQARHSAEQGDLMGRILVHEQSGCVTIDVEAVGPILGAALEHAQAEAVVRCAMLMVLSTLAEGGHWPVAVLQHMAQFMSVMRQTVAEERLM